MDKPKVSVIMAAYNSDKYIEEAILSILNQTLKDFELIIVDDCSTDNVPEIIKKYQELDPRIITVRNETNSGLTISWNRGIKLAKTDYVLMMDSDDIAYPNRLETQYNFMEQNPNVPLIGSGVELMDENGHVFKRRIGLTDPDEIKFRILLRNPFVHPSTIYRRGVFEEMGGYNKKYENSEDYALFSAITEKYRPVCIPQILLKYRQNHQSITRLSKSRKIQIENSLKISSENINQYMTLSPENVRILVSAVNQWPTSLHHILKSLSIYKNLLKLYINIEKLNEEQKERVTKIYKDDLKRIFIGYIKNRTPRIYYALKRLGQGRA